MCITLTRKKKTNALGLVCLIHKPYFKLIGGHGGKRWKKCKEKGYRKVKGSNNGSKKVGTSKKMLKHNGAEAMGYLEYIQILKRG